MKPLGEVVMEVVETKQPRDVRKLVQLVQEVVDASIDDITKEVKLLQEKGLITLEEPSTPTDRFRDFLSSRKTLWFWVTVGFTLVTCVSIVFFPETGTPLSYLRYAFGFVFAVFLPGYCLIETLFPRKDSLDEIERLTFSVGLSFAITALVGLFLGFTPVGLTLATALLTLSSIVIVLALISLNRKYHMDRKKLHSNS